MASRTAKFAKKCATEGHVKSIEHVKRIEEDALGTTIAGDAQTTRRYNGDLCVGVLTKTLIYQFGGNAVENLVRYAMDIHRAKGFFSIGKKITPNEAQYELGIVSYPGSGKYNNCLYVPFIDLPDSTEVATKEQLVIISPPNQGWWPVIALLKEREKVLVACWYQLLSDGTVVCWWIYI